MDIDLSGDLSKLKVVDLKAALTARGLDTKGIKAVLVSRLEAALADEGKSPSGAGNAQISAEVAAAPAKIDDSVAESTPAKIPARRSTRSRTRSPSPAKKLHVPETPLKTLAEEPDEPMDASTAEVDESAHEDDEGNQDGDLNESRGQKRENDESDPAKKRASSVEPHADDFTKEEDEPEIDNDKFTLSWYDSDIHLKIDQSDFLRAKPISDAGLNLVWAGARASHGVSKGKVGYEVHLSNYNRTNHNQDEKRMHEFRCGWSVAGDLQLGESELSYGYDTNAKKCTDCKFEEYGKRYGLHDVVGVYVDLDSTPCKIEYTLNGESLGTAFEFEKSILDGKALFPHISTKNVGFVINFGSVHPSLYSSVPVKPKDNRRGNRDKRPNKKQQQQKTDESANDTATENKNDEAEKPADETQEPMDEDTDAEKKENENADNSITEEDKPEKENDQDAAATGEAKKTGSLEILTDYSFINTVPAEDLIPGPKRPETREDCEVIMMIGLPGTGKTYWARNYVKENPDKKYNAFGVAFLLDKMKVNGSPRKPNNSFKWSHMVESLSRSLNILHNIACRRRRNYIIDQPNVYANLQRRKMSRFGGFQRKAVVVFPTDEDHKERSAKRLELQGKEYSPANVEEMHAKFSIPVVEHQWFNEVTFTDQNEEVAREAVKKINEEGAKAKNKRKTEREQRAKQRSRQFQGGGGNRNAPQMWGPPMRGGNWDRRPGEGYGYGRPPREQWGQGNWMRGGAGNNFRRSGGPGGMGGNFPQRNDRRSGANGDPKRQKMDQGAWGGNWNSFGGSGGFQQNNSWAQPVWNRGQQNGGNYGGGNWWQ